MAAIIFDLDGTLLDTVPDIAAALNATLAESGADPLDRASVRGFVGEGTPMLVRRALAARDLPADRFEPVHAGFLRRYRTATDLTTPYPGMMAALDTLSAAGHRLGLCTNKPGEATDAVLARFDLAARLQSVVAGDTLDRCKPDPAPLRHAMLGMEVDECIYVGDSETDAATAQAAGQPFVLFTEGYRKGDVEEIAAQARFDAFADLPSIIRRLVEDAPR